MNEKITIGLFCDSFFPMVDGVVMVVDNYAKRLTKYANVVVFVPETPWVRYDDSIFPYKVVRCQSVKVPFYDYSIPVPGIFNGFYNKVKKYKLDIVHIHSPFAVGKYGVIYAKKHHVPLIGTMHSQFRQDFEKAVISKRIANKLTRKLVRVFDDCDECWAVNKEVARIFYQDYGYKRMPEVVNNATDIMPIRDVRGSNKIVNKRYNIKSNEIVFLFVGRINRIKNILFIVDALKVLKDRKFKFKMLFVGSGKDENLLKDTISENGLDKDIIMCGRIIDREMMAALYARADLFLFPSLYDASSLVQIEAASQKTPTIFLEGSATSDTVTNNVNGFIVKNNIYDYADTIIKVMRDKKLYKQVSENAFNDLYKNWDDLVKEVYEKYVSFIENKVNKAKGKN